MGLFLNVWVDSFCFIWITNTRTWLFEIAGLPVCINFWISVLSATEKGNIDCFTFRKHQENFDHLCLKAGLVAANYPARSSII
ncbi:MAG: hypothetical protein EA394_04785 [Bacteroidia bacterium]|nr:MAG: hypothetical protein EA394_04785 [Bacteroidia bacterium]